MGWIIWRDNDELPEDLIYRVNYLGGDQASIGLNFSRSAGPIIVQYYQFLRLGFEGYKAIMENGLKNAEYLRNELIKLGFKICDKGHMPLCAFYISPNEIKDFGCTLFELSDKLATR